VNCDHIASPSARHRDQGGGRCPFGYANRQTEIISGTGGAAAAALLPLLQSNHQ
jgi:hypothetical protein